MFGYGAICLAVKKATGYRGKLDIRVDLFAEEEAKGIAVTAQGIAYSWTCMPDGKDFKITGAKLDGDQRHS